MSLGTPTLIERREYKYLIDVETAAELRAAIAPFCALDPWAAGSPSRRYTIDSLYLDTPDLALYFANEHEQVDRFKLRARTYPEVPGSPVFFEVKRRVNDVISKSRGKLARADWAALLAGPAAPLPASLAGKDRAAVARFVALARTLHARPQTLVRYRREPYFSTVDDYARVTFDTEIRAQPRDHLSFEASDKQWRALDDAVLQRDLGSRIVLELKFARTVPLWLVAIVQRLGLQRRAYSKYGNSVRAFWGALDLRTPRRAGGWR